MKIKRNGQEIELTESEMQQAYEACLHRNLCKAALQHFTKYLNDYGYDCVGGEERFIAKYCVSIDTLMSPFSDRYIIQNIARTFQEIRRDDFTDEQNWRDAILSHLPLAQSQEVA